MDNLQAVGHMMDEIQALCGSKKFFPSRWRIERYLPGFANPSSRLAECFAALSPFTMSKAVSLNQV